jgi:hypothetical protein
LHFGKENLVIIPFEPVQLEGGLERTLFASMGLDWFDGLQCPNPVNTRLTRDCLAYLSGIDREVYNRGRYRAIVRKLEEYSLVNKDPPGIRQIMSPGERLRLLERCRSSNQRVATEFLGRKDGRLFYDAEPDPAEPWEPYPGLTDAARARITEFLGEEGISLER